MSNCIDTQCKSTDYRETISRKLLNSFNRYGFTLGGVFTSSYNSYRKPIL